MIIGVTYIIVFCSLIRIFLIDFSGRNCASGANNKIVARSDFQSFANLTPGRIHTNVTVLLSIIHVIHVRASLHVFYSVQSIFCNDCVSP